MKLFGFLRGPLKFRETVIDSFMFRLHYKITFSLLMALSIVIAVLQFLGNPITCVTRNDHPSAVIDQYCYTHSTYSIKEAWTKRVGEEVPYPGVGKYTPGETRIYHTYYLWIPLVLFMQAILFFVPRYFWKTMESGRVRDMVKGFKKSSRASHADLELLVDDIRAEFGLNGRYFISYFVAELMNMVNVVCQIHLMKVFLGNEFLPVNLFSSKSLDKNVEASQDLWLRIFPTITKCTYYYTTNNGDIGSAHAICLLPINVFNAKVYVFLFLWFVILAVLSCLTIAHEMLIIIFPKYRFWILSIYTRSPYRHDIVRKIGRQCTVCDWFVICLISKNLSSSTFRNLMTILSNHLNDKDRFIEL